jgi:sarcosine oxidase subunit delta
MARTRTGIEPAMRLPCPHCGSRPADEFTCYGAADPVRPAADAPAQDWLDYVHIRPNPYGLHNELWQHVHGCRRWLVMTRDTRTHAVLGARDGGARGGGAA